MKRMRIFKISAICSACILALSFFMPIKALAYRSNTGGGKASEFDAASFVEGTAIGVASSVAGSAISSGSALGGVLGTSSTPFSFGSALDSWGSSYSINMATGQIGRATSAMGNYYGLGGQAISGISTLTTSLGSGLMSGSPGAIPESIVKGGIIYAASNSKGEHSAWVGLAADMAGDFAGGAVSHAALGDLVQGIPSHLVGVAAGEMTNDKDMMDRYVINQAFSGAYTVAGTLGSAGANALDLNTSSTIGSGGLRTFRDANGNLVSRNWLGLRISYTGPNTGKGDTNATYIDTRIPKEASLGKLTTTDPDTVFNIPVETENLNPPPAMILPQTQEAVNLPPTTTTQPYPLPAAYLPSDTEYPWGFDPEKGGYQQVDLPPVVSGTGVSVPGAPGANQPEPPLVTDWSKFNATPGAPGASAGVVPTDQELTALKNGRLTPEDLARMYPDLVTPENKFVPNGPPGGVRTEEKPELIPPPVMEPLVPAPIVTSIPETKTELPSFKSEAKSEPEALPSLPEEEDIQTNRSLPANIIQPLPSTTAKIEPRMPTTAELIPKLDSLPRPDTNMFQPIPPTISEAPVAATDNVQQENPADIDLVTPPKGVPLVFDPNMNAPVAAPIVIEGRTYYPVSLDSSEAMLLPDGSTAERLTSTEFGKQKQLDADLEKGIITQNQYDRMKNSGIIYVSPELTQDVVNTRDILTQETGKKVLAVINSGVRNDEYAQYLMKRGNETVATDSRHSITGKISDGTELRVTDAVDVTYVTVNADGSTTPIPLEDVYRVVNDVVGKQGEVGLYKDGHVHIGLVPGEVSEDAPAVRWQSGVNIIPASDINNPHEYSKSLFAVAGAHLQQATDAVKYRETGQGFGVRAAQKDLADFGAALNIGKGTTSKGPLQLQVGPGSVMEQYLEANQTNLGLSDEQVHSKSYQQRVAESPAQAERAYQWLLSSITQNWKDTFTSIGYPNAAVSEDQLLPAVYSTNYSLNTVKDRVFLWDVYNAAVKEGVIPAGTKVTASEMEPIIEALAARWETSPEDGFTKRAALRGDRTFTVTTSEGGNPITISSPGKLTLAESLKEKGVTELPNELLISGYGYRNNEKLVLGEDGEYLRRDFVSFMKSPTGRQVIDSIGGADKILPASSDIVERDPGFLGPLNRGSYAFETINREEWSKSNAAAAALPATGLTIAPTMYQYGTGSNVNAPSSAIVTDMKTLPIRSPISTIPKSSEIKDKNTVPATVTQ